MTSLRRFGCGVGARILRRLRTGLLFLAIAMAYGALPGVSLAQSYTFSSIQVSGLERIEVATVVKLSGIARGATVSAGALNDAYQAIQGSGLFESVEIVPQGGTLLIRVREYPTVNIINFEGNKILKDEELAGLIRSQSRRVYSPATVEADAQRIAETYSAQGRVSARVTPKLIRLEGNRVDIAFEIVEGAVTEIERLSFTGNRAFSDVRLRQVLGSKQAGIFRKLIRSDSFVPERVDFDKQLLTDFYRSRGYIDFQVLGVSTEFSRERNAFFLTFNVLEGQPYSFAAIRTISEIAGVDAAEFEREVRVKSGATYSPSDIDNTITRMEALALNKGLTFVQIEPRITRNDRDLTVDLTLALVRGPRVFVERIDIEGNTTTLDQVIRRQFRTVEGDPFNPREIRNGAERIRALGFFATADVTTRPGSASDQIVVDVNVAEKPTGSLSFGATYGVAAGFGANVNLQESNFLGRGQYVALSFSTAANNANTLITFIEPQLLGRDLRFKFNASQKVSDNDFSYYKTDRIGLLVALDFPVSRNGRLELRYSAARDDLFDVNPTSSAILQAEAGALISSALGYTFTHDSRLAGLNPNASLQFRFGQDFAGVGGDVQSLRTTALMVAQTKVFREAITLRAELEGGAVNMMGGQTSRVLDRFSGTGKVRGFEPNGYGPRDLSPGGNQDALGGNFYAALRLEAQFPLGLPEEYGISGGVFYDVGSVWGLNNTAGTSMAVDDTLHLRSSIGVSVFWDTVIGPLRFNFSRALIKQDYDVVQDFDLTISTQF
ncbi:MAG: outer membrane protein assembly factor BamA [Alphaproteobacteria bacterium HGW-Alphaproteobacteria-4]|nr:MAG: outer membrane protein assembly factor BamA [Alphaproteobacteria bacterium HGW-Alphaproteobacteria-4]